MGYLLKTQSNQVGYIHVCDFLASIERIFFQNVFIGHDVSLLHKGPPLNDICPSVIHACRQSTPILT